MREKISGERDGWMEQEDGNNVQLPGAVR